MIKNNKSEYLFKIITISIFVLFLFNVSVVYGAGLVPCGGGGAEPACDFNQFIVMAQTIINFILGLSVTVAVIMFTYAGILYLTASGAQDQIKKAHKIFTNVLIGFIVIISAWLVINTIANALLDKTNFDTYLNQTGQTN
ncbi:MAG: pilin [Candidatus Paceibacterota bacterium]